MNYSVKEIASVAVIGGFVLLLLLFFVDASSGKSYQEKCQILYAHYKPAWDEVVVSTDKKGKITHSIKHHDAKYYLGIETISGYKSQVDVGVFTYYEFYKKDAAIYRCRIGKWSKIHYFENIE